jgi:NAD(P)-dependent dehydrogenase (short-subunit alcohol dehydrogenase family)
MGEPISPGDERAFPARADLPAPPRNATAIVVGAGDYIGSAIAKRFAAEGYAVLAGRRSGDKLGPLVAEIETAGGRCVAQSLDARKEAEVAAFVARADAIAPLEACIFNVGANVNYPILETTERVFRKVWEMACYAGFLTGREAARAMLPHGRGSILFTGATASLRGGSGFAAFAAAKAGLRAVAQAMARELGPRNIHVAHLVIDAGVDTAWVRERIGERGGPDAARLHEPDRRMRPESIAAAYWHLHQQTRDAWTFEADLRPSAEQW